ncbi:MetQ/NlpA family ABC transporter substrate-binding protein [Fusobacterium sp. PH5-44]|uniref:MetQ/NlpA family ABC transporter substrate-binding protein n=1 Tax=unclassified Fusobacterium TaxID=2648384 RepID=UPI003D23E962
MKKVLFILTLTISSFLFCQKVKLGTTPIPVPEIIEFIKEDLKNDGLDVEVIEMSDYVTPNLALADGSIDVNAFQHIPYLENFIKDRNLELVPVGITFITPIALYSKKYKSIDEIPNNATIAIPNDPTNEGRALILFHNKGLIKLKDPTNLLCTPIDIIENPKNFKFNELEAAQLPRTIDDLDAAVINGNYAVDAGFSPIDDNLIIEDKESPYVNVFVVRKGDENREDIQKIVKHFQTEKVKEFIIEKFKGAYIPVF